MTSAAAVAAAVAGGADAIGFVFAPSVRQLEPARAAQLALPVRSRVSVVAVTLHPQQALVDEVIRLCQSDMLQSELEDFEALILPQTLIKLPVVRAAGALGGDLPHRFLFEGPRSGSGTAADWSEAARLARTSELVLAGGLDEHNVSAAIHRVLPYGVDVSSGVESKPGQKSPEKIARFIAAARAASFDRTGLGQEKV